jgi:hypothetical protein
LNGSFEKCHIASAGYWIGLTPTNTVAATGVPSPGLKTPPLSGTTPGSVARSTQDVAATVRYHDEQSAKDTMFAAATMQLFARAQPAEARLLFSPPEHSIATATTTEAAAHNSP